MNEKNKEEPVQAQVELNKLIEAVPEVIGSQLMIAKILKAKLDALVIEGFTRQEALDIIKARGLEP